MSNQDPLSIRQLAVFAALTEQKSFTKAARQLGLSQSTVSGHMADLERRLGMRLVERDRSGVEPTAAGRILLVPARDALRAERHARMAAAQLKGLLEGELVIGGSTIPAVYVLPRMLAAFRTRHDGIVARLVTGDSESVAAAVAGGEVDLALVGALPEKATKGVEVHDAGGDQLVLIAPPHHPVATQQGLRLPDLATLPFVSREGGSGSRAAVMTALNQADPDLRLRTVCEVGSTEAVKAAVRHGVGVAFVSALAAADDERVGALAVVPIEGFAIQRRFSWIVRQADRMSPAARAFREEVLTAG